MIGQVGRHSIETHEMVGCLELTYPQGEMQGRGPRRLHLFSRDEAAAKYSHAAI